MFKLRQISTLIYQSSLSLNLIKQGNTFQQFQRSRYNFNTTNKQSIVKESVDKVQKQQQQESSTKSKAKQKLNESDIKELFYLCRPEWKYFLYTGIASLISAGILMLLPRVIPEFSNLYSQKKQKIEATDAPEEQQKKKEVNKQINQNYLHFLQYWGTLCILSGLFTFMRRYYMGDLGNRISFRIRNKLYQNLIQRNTAFFYQKNISVANYVHKLANDVTAIGLCLSQDLFFGIRGVLFILGGAGYIVVKAPFLIPPALVVMAGLTWSSKIIGGLQRLYKIEEANSLARTSELANERLSNIKLIKISNTEEQEKYYYLRTLHDFYDKSRLVQYYAGLNYGILEGFGFLSLIGLLTYGSYLVTLGVAHPDMLSSAIYAFYVGMGFRSIFNSYTELKKTSGVYYGIEQLLGSVKDDKIYNDPELIDKSKDLLKEFLERMKQMQTYNKDRQEDEKGLLFLKEAPSIKLQNITFKYEEYGSERQLLQNLNLNIEKNEVVALIGPSGCGKTTVLNLISKVYSASSGQILINDKNIEDLDPSWVQKNISYVTQEPILFMGSVYENIIYGNQGFDISMENVIRASKIANAHQFIMEMPQGYDTEILERGGSLSGGQRQRIILARALIKDPKLLILDEGTANLDIESEKAIIRDLKTICLDRTCILVTHKIENYKDFVHKIIELQLPKNLQKERELQEKQKVDALKNYNQQYQKKNYQDTVEQVKK